MEFKDWLRGALADRPDLKQADLAETLGVVPSAISAWVRGKAKPRPEHVEALAAIFGVEKSTLYQLLGIEVGAPYELKTLGPLMEEVDRLIDALPDERIRRIIEDKIRNDFRSTRDLIESLTEMVEDQKS